MESLKPRAKNLNELAEGAVFLFKNRPLDLDEKAASLLDDAARVLLGKTRAALSDVQEWSPTALDEKVRGVAEDAEIGLGKVAQPLRAALTRSEEHTSELQSLMRISYAVFCLKHKKPLQPTTMTIQE